MRSRKRCALREGVTGPQAPILMRSQEAFGNQDLSDLSLTVHQRRIVKNTIQSNEVL